ncbi:MAG: DUF1622 domain-containing protein [Gammaproteobacteria bacterium]|nr:DUF1622 domain-containing protein [Rhodocyclaceae bacterium]MBU3908729.1 DUF1622 domain-containing protein [Gammaproteobacteria bacterium]MBU3988851.1 DUF1622 domain-containing protein [Gammaproteobacteria bacterium]MBU4004757.1 DUF1622 domain-containing protein [Gammaproteobacteria bacterium]MBU4021360.1 DUF1622 domain-containing protein [Gammaproteobacteria bacterium]
MEILKQVVNVAGYTLEAIGVLTILAGCVVAGMGFLREWRHLGAEEAYSAMRRRLGQGIILGLEFLIAGDIIQTVVLTQTLESAAVLAVIVLIRAFLSFTLEHSIEGRWPWQGPPVGKSS